MAERVDLDDLTPEEAAARSCVLGSRFGEVGDLEFEHYETPPPTRGPQTGIFIERESGLAYEVTATAVRAPMYDDPDNEAEVWLG